jgi:predicted MPP superfamily phosphohydrolase
VTKALWTLARQPYVRGLHEVNGNLLYVNRGLCFGPGSPLFRVRCPPELSVFTLTRVVGA